MNKIRKWNVHARFEEADGHLFRTGAYLQYGNNDAGKVIGTVIMFNPGSCHPGAAQHATGRYIPASMDPTMSEIGSIVSEAYGIANKEIEEGSRVDIRNLFNVCDPDKSEAIRKLEVLSTDPVYSGYMHPDHKIDAAGVVVWKAWGLGLPPNFSHLIEEWSSAIANFAVVGEDISQGLKCYHPLYFRRNRKLRAVLINQYSRILR